MKTDICKICGDIFRSRHKETRFCSRKCVGIFVNEKRKKRIKRICEYCGKEFETIPYFVKKGYAKYCQNKCYFKAITGLKFSLKRRMEISERLRNTIRHPEWCENISKSKKGSKSHFWKGGITDKNRVIRMSALYRKWKKQVFERDDFTCQECGINGVKIQAHHIKAFSDFPRLRFDVDNGITLCVDCHKKTDNYGNMYCRRKKEIEKDKIEVMVVK